jgi:hypothetical protein
MGPAIFTAARSTGVKGRFANPYERTSACCRCTLRLFRFRPGLPRLSVTCLVLLLANGESMIRRQKSGAPGTWAERVGANRALKPQQVWAIRFWLDRERRLRDQAMFALAIDSKLRGCDVVKVKIGDLVSGGQIRSCAIVIQHETGEGRIYYRFHPRCGETVLIKRQLEHRGVVLVVILQPDCREPAMQGQLLQEIGITMGY